MTTVFCQQVADRKRCCPAEEESRAGAETAFRVDGIPLAQVTSFKYLSWIITSADDDWPEVVINLRKARQKLALKKRALGRERGDYQTLGQIYLVVVQLVILYGSETWFMNPRIGRVLGRFHHRVARRLIVRQPQRGRNGVWTYPPLE